MEQQWSRIGCKPNVSTKHSRLKPYRQNTDDRNVSLITQGSRVQIPPPQPLTQINGATVDLDAVRAGVLERPHRRAALASSATRTASGQAGLTP